jgi:hypothetical protein
MFRFIGNVFMAFDYSCWSFVMTVITGRLATISPHKLIEDGDAYSWNLCSEKHIKAQYIADVDVRVKEQIIRKFVAHLGDSQFDVVIKDVSFPIFDGKDVIGEQGYYPVLNKEIDNFIKEQK